MLHMLRTVGATGWLVSQKVLSLLWLAILSPGYYSDLCVFVCVCALPVPIGKRGDCRGLHKFSSACAVAFVLKCMCYFIDQNVLNESVFLFTGIGRLTRLFHEGTSV